MRVPLPAQRYPDAARRIAFFQDLLPRVERGARRGSRGLNSGLHPLGNMWTPVEVAGEPPRTDPVQIHSVSAGYTERWVSARGGPAVDGHRHDGAQPVALVNERFVRARLNGLPPLGRVVRIPRLRRTAVLGSRTTRSRS